MAKKYLTIQEALKQKSTDNLWVINNSSESSLGITGEIIIPIVDQSGRRSNSLVIRSTWLPTNLQEEMDRETILGSAEFRTHLKNGLIRIITEEYASELNNDPMAATERKRLESKRSKDLIDQALSMAGSSQIEVQVEGKSQTANNEYQKGISFAFKTWVDNLQVRDEADIISEFRTRKVFTNAELKFLHGNLQSKPQVIDYIKSMARAKRKKKA